MTSRFLATATALLCAVLLVLLAAPAATAYNVTLTEYDGTGCFFASVAKTEWWTTGKCYNNVTDPTMVRCHTNATYVQFQVYPSTRRDCSQKTISDHTYAADICHNYGAGSFMYQCLGKK